MLPSSPRCGPSRVGYATDWMVMTWLTIARLTVKLHETRPFIDDISVQISLILRQQVVEFYLIKFGNFRGLELSL